MRWYRNLPVIGKLGLSFGIATALTVIVGLVALQATSSVSHIARDTTRYSLQRSLAMEQIGSGIRDARIRIVRSSLTPDVETVKKELAKLSGDQDKVSKAVKRYEDACETPKDHENIKSVAEQIAVQDKMYAQMAELDLAMRQKEAQVILDGPCRKAFREGLVPALEEMSKLNEESATRLTKSANNTASWAFWVVLGTVTCAVFISTVMAWYVASLIRKPILQLSERLHHLDTNCLCGLVDAMEAIGQGDLTVDWTPDGVPIEDPANDEVGTMCTAFNAMMAKSQYAAECYGNMQVALKAAIENIQQSSKAVTTSGIELNAATLAVSEGVEVVQRNMHDVSTATSESAASTEEIAKGSQDLADQATQVASAMERLGQTCKTVAKSASDADAMTDEAVEAATLGKKAVQRAAASMARIKGQVDASAKAVEELDAKSQQIGAILETIDSIARQTNLLALNAAIEAARAGDQGKGFAVVADEVRKLAENASTSTAEISELINAVRDDVESAVKAMEASRHEVATGATESQAAADALASIDTMIATVKSLTHESQQFVVELAGGFTNVQDTTTNVATVSEQCAAASEQLSACTEEIAASAENVSSVLGQQSAAANSNAQIATSMTQTAQKLKEFVDCFRISEQVDAEVFADKIVTFKKAHLGWVDRVKNMLDGNGVIPDKELLSHKHCALGRWYYGIGARMCGDLREFSIIEEPHALLHETAAMAVKAYRAGDIAAATRHFTTVKDCSRKVVAGLESLEKAVIGSGNSGRKRAA